MILAYMGQQTWLHRSSTGAKLIALAVFSLVLAPVDQLWILLLALGAVLALYASLGRAGLVRLKMIRPLLPLLAIIAVLHFFVSGWNEAAGSVTRLLALVFAADLVTATTTMQAMMAAISPVLAPLRWLGLRTQNISLAVALVLRFVPMLMTLWVEREEAFRARTGENGGFKLIAPFLGEALNLADGIAEALDARGFASDKPQ